MLGGLIVPITQWRPIGLYLRPLDFKKMDAEPTLPTSTINWTLDRHTRALTLTTPISLAKERRTCAVKNRYVAFVIFHFANIAQYHPSLPPFTFSSVYRLINTFKCLLSISMSRYFAKSYPRLLLHLQFFCMIVFSLSVCHPFH